MTYSFHGEFDDPCFDERAELLAERRARRRHHAQFVRHPDCCDPDHPGCSRCQDEDAEGDDE